jgi:hypothetical protein
MPGIWDLEPPPKLSDAWPKLKLWLEPPSRLAPGLLPDIGVAVARRAVGGQWRPGWECRWVGNGTAL